jgi:hypothetical protein
VGFGKSKKLGSQVRGESLGEFFFFFFVGFFPAVLVEPTDGWPLHRLSDLLEIEIEFVEGRVIQ